MNELRMFVADMWQFFDVEARALGVFTHWTLLVLSLLFSLACGALASYLVRPIVHKIIQNTKNKIDDLLLNDNVLRSACRIIPAIIYLYLAPMCFEGHEHDYWLYILIERASRIYLIMMIILLISHILDNVSLLGTTHDRLRKHYIGGLVQFVKLCIYFIGAIIIVSIVIDRSPVSLIAGLGAAATVLMLLFRDSIVGLVAGIQLNVNDMLKPGDWITIKKLGVDGYVQKVSLTTVKVLNFDNTIATIPPSVLVSDSFMNWKEIGKRGRRVKRLIYIDVESVRFCTPEEVAEMHDRGLVSDDEATAVEPRIVNLTVFRRFITDFLRSDAEVKHDDWLMVRQLEHTQGGLPIELYFYYQESDFVRYEQLAAEAMEYIIASAAQFGVRLYQSPTGGNIAALLSARADK
ncbi:MAG: mechanosensitive ion channel [Muribaculaceae bacterium]|nr:mechanosensitive ion channel [Muribaculaceae bacterium]